MIYFTKAVDYSIRALVHMSHSPRESFDITTLSQEVGVPASFLAKLFQKLSRAGIVHSKRGVSGGFVLGRGAHEISAYEIIYAVGGFDSLSKRLTDENALMERRLWGDVNMLVEEHLKGVSLARLVVDAQYGYGY